MPFKDLENLSGNTFFYIVTLTAFLTFFYWLNRGIYRNLSTNRIVILTFSNALLSILLIFYTFTSLSSSTDETFLLASQVRHFHESGKLSVPIFSNENGVQSSADTGVLYLSSILKSLIPTLQYESYLIISNLVLVIILFCAIQYNFISYFGKRSIPFLTLVTIAIMLSPTFLNSLGTGMPVASNNLALACIVTILLCGKQKPLIRIVSLLTFIAIFSRWEYLLYVICVALALSLINLGKWSKVDILKSLSIPISIVLIDICTRKVLYGHWFPVSVIYKSQEITVENLRFGFEWIAKIDHVSRSISICIAITVILFLIHRRDESRKYLLFAVLISFLPTIQTVFAGGDWFSSNWERFVGATYFCLLIVLIFEILESSDYRKFIAYFSVFIVVVTISIFHSKALPIVYHFIKQERDFGRVDCLASAGKLIHSYVPKNVGIASAELNTVAYFSHQNIYDLLGIANLELAASKDNPLNDGDLLHKKNHKHLTISKLPPLLYLYEGAYCLKTEGSMEYKWNDLIQSKITQYRLEGLKGNLSEYVGVELRSSKVTSLKIIVSKNIFEKYFAKKTSAIIPPWS